MAYEMITLSSEEHDNFVKNHKYGELNQIYKWQFVKKGWIGKNIGIKKDGKLVGACLILLRKLPVLPYYFAYAPKGPVIDYENKDDFRDILNFMLIWYLDLIYLKSGREDNIVNVDKLDLLKLQDVSIQRALKSYDAIINAIKRSENNINFDLNIENLLMELGEWDDKNSWS